LFLEEEMLEILSKNVEIRFLKTLKFLGGKLRRYISGFLNYDLTAVGFSVVTVLLGGNDFDYEPLLSADC